MNGKKKTNSLNQSQIFAKNREIGELKETIQLLLEEKKKKNGKVFSNVEKDFRKFYNFKSIRFTKQETEMMSLMNEVFTVILPSNDGIISLYYDPEMTLLRVLQTVVAQRSYYNVENYELSLEENDKNFLDPMKKMKDIRKKIFI